MTSVLAGVNRKDKEEDQKIATVCLPYVKSLWNRFRRSAVYIPSGQYSKAVTLYGVKSNNGENMIKNCSCGREYNGETSHSLKVGREVH